MRNGDQTNAPVSIVAIHQPNYAPWLGYFHKIAHADKFIFLDNVQFSRNSYTNRVRIAWHGPSRWLTQPVRRRFSEPICEVSFAEDEWPTKHLDTLRGTYRRASNFRNVWDTIVGMYETVPRECGLAASNQFLIETLVQNIDLKCEFSCASDYSVGDNRSDDRLIALVQAVAPGASYLSGTGATKYLDATKFTTAGVPLQYLSFEHPVYPRGSAEFLPGLSILDVVFHLGWHGTRALIVSQDPSNDIS